MMKAYVVCTKCGNCFALNENMTSPPKVGSKMKYFCSTRKCFKNTTHKIEMREVAE
jgi:hypothetical protein